LTDSGPSPATLRLERRILVAFLLTFCLARIEAILFLTHRIPLLYLYLGGTHVHHLNIGIFLLAIVGGFLLLGHPSQRGTRYAATGFGIGLALTFDEFGLWLHLGGSYWTRGSFDAIVVIAALLALVAIAPALRAFRRPRHWVITAVLIVVLLVFGALLVDSFNYADRLLLRLQLIEQTTPPAPR